MESIKDYAGRYSITEDGRIWSHKRSIWLKEEVTKDGYVRYTLCKNGKTARYSAHRLVAKQFIPNKNSLPVVNHKNGVKNDNHFLNLEWCTHKENVAHAEKTGLRNCKGEKSPNSKLTQKQVLEIRELHRKGLHSYSELSNMFSVSKGLVAFIVRRESWKHI